MFEYYSMKVRNGDLKMGAGVIRFAGRYRSIICCLVLILSTALAYSRIAGNDFVNYDDPYQVTQEDHVLGGLTWENILWSFGPEARCSPLTWMAYAAGHSLFGLNPGMFHIMSLVIHIAGSVLLFSLLRRMTGKFWESAFVGALFALHPINVESVAWVAELNNVLSGLFFMLTLLLYSRYAEQPILRRYVAALLAFGLGLLVKPVLMTLPFILLLIDLWPLKRIQPERDDSRHNMWGMTIRGVPLSRILLEKVPFALLAAASLISNIYGAEKRMGLYSADIVPMGLRISNALVSSIKYLGKLFWPHDLTIFYPYPSAIPLWQVAVAVLILALFTVSAVRMVLKRPYILVGWLWFLAGLVPFLGIIQAGIWPELADRYAYLTFIGIFIVISWGASELLGRFRYRRVVITAAGTAAVLILTAATWNQTGHWKNSETLFRHALEVTENNHLAHYNLGFFLLEQGNMQEAISHFRRSLEILPKNPSVLNNLGLALFFEGDMDGAISAYREALEASPGSHIAHVNLGYAYTRKGDEEKAIEHFIRGLQSDPHDSKARNCLSDLFLRSGRIDEALEHYHESLRLNPHQPFVHNSLGHAYMKKGNMRKAVECYENAVRLDPRDSEAKNNLINARATLAKSEELIAQVKATIQQRPQDPRLYMHLGDLYFRQGAYDEAITEYQKSLSIQHESVNALYGLAVAYSQTKDYGMALESLQSILRLMPDSPDVHYNIACIYAKQSKVDESIYWLDKSIQKGFNNWNLIRTDPDLHSIRGTEGMQRLVRENEAIGAGRRAQ